MHQFFPKSPNWILIESNHGHAYNLNKTRWGIGSLPNILALPPSSWQPQQAPLLLDSSPSEALTWVPWWHLFLESTTTMATTLLLLASTRGRFPLQQPLLGRPRRWGREVEMGGGEGGREREKKGGGELARNKREKKRNKRGWGLKWEERE